MIATDPVWQVTAGKLTQITENDCGYDWDFNGEQFAWEPSLRKGERQ